MEMKLISRGSKSGPPDCYYSNPDVYFLIQKFLSSGPLSRTLKTLNEELHEFNILPTRIDWQGDNHERTVEEMRKQFPQVRDDFLHYLCTQASATLNPNSALVPSILSFRPSPKTINGVYRNCKQYLNYVTKAYETSLKEAKTSFNIINSIRGREIAGPLTRRSIVTPKLYLGMQMQRCTVGHLSAVYCLLFDHSGRYVITGADDLLIKLWSVYTGRLLAVFRGASSEITDIAVDPENFVLAAGSIDRILRVWNLQTGAPVAVLTGHTGMITSVNFCPTPCWNLKYLISTSTDGSVAFWTYNSDGIECKVEFRNRANLYQEKIRPGQAQMICSSFSPGGTFLVTGSADHHVRVYHMKGEEGPQRILQTEAHTDRVDSIQWGHSGLKFLSGSKDGTAIVWWFERQQWRTTYLDMRTKLPSDTSNAEPDSKKIRVTMVAWDRSDVLVVTAVSDHSLKVWDSCNGQLVRVLTGHTDEVYVLESHPHDDNVMLSAGHDGQLVIWDINRGEILFKYLNSLEGQGHGAIFDAKWSPDGCTISASDSHGDILTFGMGTGNPFFKELPKELFFHTDYRPLVRDQNYAVLDEQTQVPPHQMPPPFLVDIDGNPYPPVYQRLVPGRESCNVEQLVPNIIIGNEGIQEVIQDAAPLVYDESDDDDIRVNPGGSVRAQRIRQSTGDWQTDHSIEWKKSVLIQPLSVSVLKRANETRKLTEQSEIKEYQKQLRTRPLMISTAGPSVAKIKEQKKRITKRIKKQQVIEEHYEMVMPALMDDGVSDESPFSDWAEEVTESRKRRSKRRQKYNPPDSSSDEDDSGEDTGQSDNSDESDQEEQSPRAGDRSRHAKKQNGTRNSSRSKATKGAKKHVIPKKDLPKLSHLPKLSEPSTSEPSTSKGPKIKVSEQYKLSEWLSETCPRKSPYYPQIHDEIVYFIQGHILYIEAVKQKNVYEPNIKDLPWVKGMQLRDHEFCKVVGIRYEIKPPRLCCLKLALQDENGRLIGKTFTIKFHDMPDVLDFFVLKQCYLTALSRDWRPNDRFRCMIDDNWWIGEVSGKSPATELYPDSVFMCYEIRWTNGEQERMSPWDMEPVDDSLSSSDLGEPEDEKEAVPVLSHELMAVLYKPTAEDWPNCDREATCQAISRGIAQVMELAIAEPFLVPVDINVYPTYATIVEYPIDLSTIKARFENSFYRRVSAAQFDVHYLETNAAKFNEHRSTIVKHAKIITELCLRIMKSGTNDIDIAAVYHQLADGHFSSSSEDESVDMDQPSTSRSVRYQPVRSWKSPNDWKIEARGLVELMVQTEDSVPFREPVNKHKYPTYHQIIATPMDLNTIKGRLQRGVYNEPREFCSDMRLIFHNSRTFNTNKRSRIYVMTVRLSAMFEEQFKKIISNWRVAKKRQRHLYHSASSSSSSSEDVDVEEPVSPVKVVVERIEYQQKSDSDSDNTPLEALKIASQSNTATESDNNTMDQNNIAVSQSNGKLTEMDEPPGENSNDRLSDNVPNRDKPSAANSKDNKNVDSDESDGEYEPPRKVLQSGSSSDDNLQPSTSKKKPPTNGIRNSSDSDENLLQLQTELRRKKVKSDDDFCPDDSSRKSSSDSSESGEDSSDKSRSRRRKRVSSFVVEDTDYSSTSSSSDSNTSDDILAATRRRKRKAKQEQAGTSDSEEDKPRKKRRRDKGNRGDKRRTYFGPVSSRGRVRKITERAAAFLKKDKKAG